MTDPLRLRADLISKTYERLGDVKATAQAVGSSYFNVRRSLERAGKLKLSAASLLEPPRGHLVRGTSTLVDADGAVKLQWVKTREDDAHRERAMAEAVAAMIEPARGIVAPVTAPAVTMADILAVIPLGDAHVGMLAWAEETGGEWDLPTAERVITGAAHKLISISPPAAELLLINLGDFFHVDDQSNRTRAHGHQLDAAARYPQILRAGVRIMRAIIDAALLRFGAVTVDNARGNHDDHSAVFLAELLAVAYEREPRVKVITSPSMQHYHERGKLLIGTSHGHRVKMGELPSVMAAEQAQAWGRTEVRHIYTGHVHRDSLLEARGCTVESVNVLAARDAYAAGSGYISGRELKLDLWDIRAGIRRARHTVSASEV